MIIRNYHWLNSASRVYRPAPHHWFKRESVNKQKHTLFDLTFDLQSQASQDQGRPSCQKSRSKVNRFKQESAHRQTDGHTHTHTHTHRRYQMYYLPCCAVDNKIIYTAPIIQNSP